MIESGYKLSHSEYLKLAIPFMISTVTQPLLGVVDTAVVGQLSSAIYIGGVSIGATIFNTIYWLFGFLRVSTTSYSAQSVGSRNERDRVESFVHNFVMAIIIGLLIVLFQSPMWNIIIKILSPEALVKEQSSIYYSVLVWGAPLVLANYVILGWLMGQAKIKESVVMQVSGNILNIVLDIIFVKIFDMKVEGVAIATLSSQIFTFIIGATFMIKCSNFKKIEFLDKGIWNKGEIIEKIVVSKDFIIRTICLLIVNNIFIARSSSFGVVVLAANTIILQLESIIAYLFEGLANASSVFAGKAVGDKSNDMLKLSMIRTFQWSVVLMIGLTLGYLATREHILFLFTHIDEVIIAVKTYDRWIVIYPVVACLGLTFYGVFSGAMATKAIRNSTFLSMILFVVVCNVGVASWGNHGLWIAFLSYYFGRTIFLLMYIKTIYIEEENEELDYI